MLHMRVATSDDIPEIKALMSASMAQILPQFLNTKQVERSTESMGVDTLLIADGTYFLVFDGEELAGCGGWSRRRTLFGGDATAIRDDTLANIATEPAKIRAMFTHPDFVRRGIGRLLIDAGEKAAIGEGFKAMELGSTAPGIPLYEACGYRVIEDVSRASVDGTMVPTLRMRKELA